MVGSVNSINTLTDKIGLTATGGNRVMSAIQNASARSGVDFSYLLNKAAQESSLDPTAKARSSSATGLYQFIDQTWLKTIKEHGADYGLGDMADKITISSNGTASVANAADKKAILALRKDPEVSANMAAELAKDNKESLERTVGGKVGSTELYMAHFLGSGGATAFLKTMQVSPNANAADILPKAASANPEVFYDKTTGRARSLSEIYTRFAQKFDKAPDMNAMTRMANAASTTSTSTQVAANTNETQAPTAPILAPQGSSQTTLRRRAYAANDTDSSQSQGGMTLSNGVQLGAKTDSSFAAMMLAQMDMDTFGIQSMSTKSDKLMSTDEQRRKGVLSTLASSNG